MEGSDPHNPNIRPVVLQQGGREAPPIKSPGKKVVFLLFALFVFLLATIVVRTLTLSPKGSGEVMVEIKSGMSVQNIAELLKEGGVIRSPLIFELMARWTNADTGLGSGVYKFKMPMDVFAVLEQLRLQEHGIIRLKITIPEGTTLSQMSELFAKALPAFDKKTFLNETEGKEGYLFPDTYFFFANATSGPIVEVLEENFTTKTATLQSEATLERKDWNDVLVMASLIEEEAVKDEDRKIVSGILWARIAKGMRLQVDAPFVYLMGKSSSEITMEDLAFDSPYNTYKYAGLPPTPISNPGLLAISAAIHPTKTPYLYYLSDKQGVMHYAKTFEEHKLNKEKYLY